MANTRIFSLVSIILTICSIFSCGKKTSSNVDIEKKVVTNKPIVIDKNNSKIDTVKPSEEAHSPKLFRQLADMTSVTVGELRSCGLTKEGGVKCWEQNNIVASKLTEIGTNATAISSGGTHSCVLSKNGGVKCWGSNSLGQLGNGSEVDSDTPVQVTGLESGVVAISVGDFNHTCALTSAGGVRCWGANGFGNLGNGNTKNSSVPIDVTGLDKGVIAISAGENLSCALLETGAVKCWGINSLAPTAVEGLNSGVASISSSYGYACAVLTSGGLKCWGNNNSGRLGNGTTIDSMVPSDVTGLSSGVRNISTAPRHVCALMLNGNVKCWGFQDEYGQLGNGGTDPSSLPVDVVGLSSGIAKVEVGRSHSCALTEKGTIKCWGRQSSAPVQVDGLLSGVTSISLGSRSACALVKMSVTQGNSAMCWGANGYGNLGNGTKDHAQEPTQVKGLEKNVEQISVGNNFACAVTTAGALKCWGQGGVGQLGNSSFNDSAEPVAVKNLNLEFVSVSAGQSHACALNKTGGVVCWGFNSDGQLGRGTASVLEMFAQPTDVKGLQSGAIAVVAGYKHSCSLLKTGTVKCWGSNSAGSLGDGTLLDRNTPVDVAGLSEVSSISVHGNETCALVKNGGIKCWGAGINSATDLFDLKSGIKSVSGFCAVTLNGGVSCWGRNGFGQLGRGSSSSVINAPPEFVIGLQKGMTSVASSGGNACSVSSEGGVYCWGYPGSLGVVPFKIVDILERQN